MNNVVIKEDKNIENLIYEIRGKQVMLDSDLAKLYMCKNGTKEINQAVKNNLDKFPKRFSWILSDDEWDFLRSKFLTLKVGGRGKFRKYKPRVFTEQGVAMLATILKTEVATKVSIAIMDAFVAMRHYIGDNYIRLNNIETKIIEHDQDIKVLKETFSKFEQKKNEIYFNGEEYDAYSRVIDIFKESNKELIIIDNYVDKSVLDIIKRLNVKVKIIIKNNSLLTKEDIRRYNKQYNNLEVIYNSTFHDRYFIIDNNKIYHSGTSINKIGNKTFSINLISDDIVKETLLNKIKDM